LKQFRIPTKNKNDSKKFSGQQLRRYMVERAPSGFPARTASHEQDVQSQRRSAFERLGSNESQNRERKRAKSNAQEKKGAEHLTTHHLDSFQEQIIIGRKKELSQSTEKLGHMIGSHVF
jgi:predicted outer membrane protein